MEKEEFFDKIKEKSTKIGLNLSVEQMNKFYNYMNLLIEWNEKINLTAIIEPEDIILKHFIDSLTIVPYLNSNTTLVDVGTGAGFPGIPVSIVREDIKITLVDSLQKRLNFLEEVVSQLNIKNVKMIHARAEEFGRNKEYREKYDYATSRAVANLSTLSEYLVPLIKIEGKCICMKSSDIEEEKNQAENAIKKLGGKIEKIEKFNLPDSDIGRSIIIINKTSKTPEKYPRKPGIPSKEPLK